MYSLGPENGSVHCEVRRDLTKKQVTSYIINFQLFFECKLKTDGNIRDVIRKDWSGILNLVLFYLCGCLYECMHHVWVPTSEERASDPWC